MARLRGFRKLTPVDEALGAFLKISQVSLRKTMVPLDSALNRVLAEPLIAGEDLPRISRSAVDGYAVKSKDTAEASQLKPKTMTITGADRIGNNEAAQIWTGSPVPRGADAVVMLENAEKTESRIDVWTPLTPGENVSRKGEDIKKGETAIESGVRLRPHHLGLMAALGITEAAVYEKPKIAVLATGNELVEIGCTRRTDQVFEVNRHVISALCQELGAEALDLGIVEDNPDAIAERLKTGLTSDAVITTGGTSVGASDLVPDVVNEMGKPGVIAHGIAMRPAMPTALATLNKKPVIILSGNPVAAMVAFEVFARPLICRMLGLDHEEARPIVKARMVKRVASTLGRKTFLRVRVFQRNDKLLAEPISSRGSSIISTMTKSNAYVVVPENREGLEEGEPVLAHLFDSLEKADTDVQETIDTK